MTKHRESKILPGGQIIMCGQKELKGEDRAQLSEETYYMKIHINIHYTAKMCYTFMPDHSCCVKIRSSEGRPGPGRGATAEDTRLCLVEIQAKETRRRPCWEERSLGNRLSIFLSFRSSVCLWIQLLFRLFTASLTSFVFQHALTPLSLPHRLLLPGIRLPVHRNYNL